MSHPHENRQVTTAIFEDPVVQLAALCPLCALAALSPTAALAALAPGLRLFNPAINPAAGLLSFALHRQANLRLLLLHLLRRRLLS